MKTKHLIIVLSLELVSFTTYTIGDDIIARLHLKHADTQNYILSNITGSFGAEYDIRQTNFFSPRIKDIHTIVSGDKAAAAKEFCQYVKDYLNSEEFIAAYQKKREASRPQSEPQPTDPSITENMRASIKELEGQLVELKKNPKQNAQAIAAYEPMVVDMKASLAEYEDPTPNKTKWERNYPSDPAVLVHRKLQEYLDLVASVDFDAKLTEPDKYKIVKFVNPQYEGKPPYWKACYRAGREANGAATAFVKEWLKGDIISATKTRIAVDQDVASNSRSASSSTGANSNVQSTISQAENESGSGDDLTNVPKEKKSLLGKMKDKAKVLIKE